MSTNNYVSPFIKILGNGAEFSVIDIRLIECIYVIYRDKQWHLIVEYRSANRQIRWSYESDGEIGIVAESIQFAMDMYTKYQDSFKLKQ
jgi:hypothetical protein